EGTYARLKGHLRELIEPKIGEHRGHIVKATGDGLLAEFASVVDAVRCALAVQRGMAERNAGASAEARIEFRIGINLGDVIFEEGDIYGDGVNVAARLEGLAEPGGICVAANVYEQVRDKLDVAFEDIGEQTVKNIARPVRAYRARLDLGATVPSDAEAPVSSERERGDLVKPDKPSLAVLPFANMSGDPEQEYFADGITEDIITALSRVRSFFVIARNSSFTYKGRALAAKQIGRELGVRYILEGSVRKAGARLRITGQLIDAETDAHVWADRYDGAAEDVFDLQDRITESVAAAIEPRLQLAEIERARRKRPENLSAYDRYLRALSHFYLSGRDELATTLRYLEETIRLDPDYAPPYALAAACYVHWIVEVWTDDPERDRAEGVRLARAAVERDRDDPTVLWMAGHALGYLAHDWDASIALLDRSLALNPNSASGYCFSAWGRCYIGDYETAIRHFHIAMRLSPVDRTIFLFYSGLALALCLSGQHEEAIAWAQKAIQEEPSWTTSYRVLASSLAQLGRLEEAKAAMRRQLELQPNYTIAITARVYRPSPAVERYLEGLRLAGEPT
ncbi:MAG TPA: adenylate/guanylate cyclase domain-containing protein, partial [Alphaproteobacteria bacterium]|nr:adenylate/guanylate cyclase domain-containing protein [Alphaproteobacteria bacterium]